MPVILTLLKIAKKFFPSYCRRQEVNVNLAVSALLLFVIAFSEVPVFLLLPVLFGLPLVPKEKSQEDHDDHDVQQQVVVEKGHLDVIL